MTSGATFLGAITVVVISGSLMALHFRRKADRAESGGLPASNFDPVQARKTAASMLILAPIIWFTAVLVSFGTVPAQGIDPIKF